MQCPWCQHENAPRMNFCGACGTPLTANPSDPPAPKFVELHGGGIGVQSQVGQGSTLTFTLPVRPEGKRSSDQAGGVSS
jgi:hypothetical protein